MECGLKRCGKDLKGRQKRWCSPSHRVIGSRERNYRKIVRRARRPVGERPLNARERSVLEAVRARLSEAASIYSAIRQMPPAWRTE